MMNREKAKEMIRKSDKLDREILENREKRINELFRQNEKLENTLLNYKICIIASILTIIISVVVNR